MTSRAYPLVVLAIACVLALFWLKTRDRGAAQIGADADTPAEAVPSAPAVPQASPDDRPQSPASHADEPRADDPRAEATGMPVEDLYPRFQAALSSNDLTTVERGLAAWNECVGYVGVGQGSLEQWLVSVMPKGLSPAERQRRAESRMKVALPCAGFARQPHLAAEGQMLMRRAAALGSPHQLLSNELNKPEDERADHRRLAGLWCDLVRRHAGGGPEIRLASVGIYAAARRRPEHILNRVESNSRHLAINLALCDIDPPGCGLQSNFIGSACMQKGECDNRHEEQYWRRRSTPAEFAAAQPIRHALVRAIRQRDCRGLF